MHLKRLLFIILSVISILAPPLSAQQFRGLTVEDGLSDLVVNTIYKDSAGYVWLGTGASLDRFDGMRVKRYSIPGTATHQQRVNAITETADGRLWIGNNEGIFSLSDDGSALTRVANDRIMFRVNSLYPSGDTLYIGTERGLFLLNTRDNRLGHVVPSRDVMSRLNIVYAIEKDPAEEGSLWLATPAGLLHCDATGQRLELERFPDREEIPVNDIAIESNIIYIATASKGIITFDTDTHEYSRYIDLGSSVITALAPADNGLLYAATDGSGIHLISTRRRKVVSTIDRGTSDKNGRKLRSNSVYSLLVDHAGQMWVGYYQGGIDYTLFQRDLVETYKADDILNTAGMTVRALGMHGSEKLIGTREGLYYVDSSRGTSARFTTPDDMRASMVFTIMRNAADGRYYVGTYGGGIYIFDPANMSLIDFAAAKNLSNSNIFVITTDNEGTMWVGTSSGIYCYRNGVETAHYTDSNSRLLRGNVYEIYFDSAGRGWICTETGVCVYNGSEIRDDSFPNGFINHDKIREVYEDSNHNLWFMPDRGAVTRSNMELTEWQTVTVDPKSNTPGAGFIIEDRDGRVWFGTSDGLSHIDKDGILRPLTYADGVPSPIFTLMNPMMDENGDLWLGNSDGLLRIDTSRLDEETGPKHRPVVTDVIVNGKSVMAVDPRRAAARVDGFPVEVAKLTGDHRNITFQVSDLIYTSPEQAVYEYRLDGVDKEWKSIVGKSEINYFDLSPGSYKFHLRYTGAPDTETTTSFSIERATNYPLLIMGLMLIVVSGAAIYLWIRHKHTLKKMTSAQGDGPVSAGQNTEAAEKEKYKTTRVSNEECRRMLSRLDRLMKENRPYTNPDLKIADLAVTLGVSQHSLSFLFNQYLDKSYYDYVNEYRVKEFKVLIDAGGNERYTLTAMSEMCGFSSRASFFRHFKKLTGITPNEYIKQQR